jgi:hypothetical protein
MEIPFSTLDRWRPEATRHMLSTGAALRIVRRIYCARMRLANLCVLEPEGGCERCHSRVTGIFAIAGSRNPAAVLTWKAKDAAAQARDEALAARDLFPAVPTPEGHNPFEAFTL